MTGGLYVEESGPDDAPLVVLVHGTMDRSSGFAKVARRLEDRYRIVRYDRRGYARSAAIGGPYTCRRHVDDLLEVMEDRDGVVVGHSYGGNVALAASIAAPDQVRAVGVYEIPLPWLPTWPTTTAGNAALNADRDGGPEDAAEQFFRRLVGDAVWERLPERTKVERRGEGHALVGEMADLRERAPWRIDDIVVPVVGGHGTRSMPHHPPAIEWLVDNLPRATLVTIDGAGHGAHLSHPDGFASFVEHVVAAAALSP
jgi:pimeloyl-ACP methyl ester carboxylesterase